MQMLTKIFRKSESRLSFSCENTVTYATNLRGRSKHVRRDERFLSSAQIEKPYHEPKSILIKKHLHRAFIWLKYAYISLLMSRVVNLLAHGTG